MDFSSLNPLSSNSLNLAARNNDVKNVRQLLKKINPNCVDNRGWTCLHEAANSDSYECLELIIKHPDCRPLSETHEGHTALYLACRNQCSLKIIKLLLEMVKDIANYSSTEGVTPLHVVSEQGRVEVIQLLLDYGAIIDVQDFDGDTPLHEACLAKKPEAMMVLLHAGANPLIQNEHLFTPFHLACSRPCLEVVSNLIYFIDDVNQKIITGDTPLMIAVHSNCDDIARFLLDNGANPNLKNLDNKMALDIALQMGYSSAFKMLLPVTDHDLINVNIVHRACKVHCFEFNILEAILTDNGLGPNFFQFSEPCHEPAEALQELEPRYLTHATLNAFLRIAEYIYNKSCEKFNEYFYLFLMRGVSVNAVEATEFPPLAYIQSCNHANSFHRVSF